MDLRLNSNNPNLKGGEQKQIRENCIVASPASLTWLAQLGQLSLASIASPAQQASPASTAQPTPHNPHPESGGRRQGA